MPFASVKDIDIGVVGTDDAQIMANELELFTVVRNLVDNAIRYTPVGGKVDLDVTPNASGVTLRITDSGPGIAITERDRVFDPFYRTLGNDEQGSGLGLSIVKAICERMGADLKLAFGDESTQSGLSVIVTIPTTTKRPHQGPLDAPPESGVIT